MCVNSQQAVEKNLYLFCKESIIVSSEGEKLNVGYLKIW